MVSIELMQINQHLILKKLFGIVFTFSMYSFCPFWSILSGSGSGCKMDLDLNWK